MATTAPKSLAIRLGLEGRAQIEEDLRRIKEAGDRSMAGLATSLAAPTQRLGEMERAAEAAAAAARDIKPVAAGKGATVSGAGAAADAVRETAAAARAAQAAGGSAEAVIHDLGDAADQARAGVERLRRSLEAVPATARAASAASQMRVSGAASGYLGGAALLTPGTAAAGSSSHMAADLAAAAVAGRDAAAVFAEIRTAATAAGKQATEAFQRAGAATKAARLEFAGLAREAKKVAAILLMMPALGGAPHLAAQTVPVMPAPVRQPVTPAVPAVGAGAGGASTAPVVRGLADVDRAAVAARSAVSGLWAELKSGAALVVGIEGIRRGLVGAAQAAMDLDRTNTVLYQATGSIAAAGQEYRWVRDEAYRLGLVLSEASGQYSQFASAAKETKLQGLGARETFLGVAEAAAVLGLRADDTRGTFVALGQILSKGKAQAEEIRGQLGERLPGAFLIASRAMGVSTSELDKMMAAGKLISEDFLPKFAVELRKTYADALPAAVKSARAEINRLTNTFQESQAYFGRGFLRSFTEDLAGMSEAWRSDDALKRMEEIGAAVGSVAAALAQAAAFAVDNADLLALAVGTRLVIALGRAAVAFTTDAAAALRSAAAQRAAAGAVAAQAAAAAAATTTTTTATVATTAATVATAEAAAADRVATAAAGQRSAAVLGLATALRGKAAASGAAAVAALTSARANMTAAQSAIAAAGATATFGARLGAGVAAGGLFAGALGALGGPIGLLVMGLTVAVPLIYSLSTAEDRATDAARAHADQIERMTDVNRQLIGASKEKQRALLAEQEIIAAKAQAEMEIQQDQLNLMREAQAAALAPRLAEIAQRRDQSSRLWMRGQVTDEMAAIDMPLPFRSEDIAEQEKKVGELVQTYQTLADAIRAIRDLIDGPAGGGGAADSGKDSEIKAGREAIEALIRDREAAAKRLQMIDLLGVDTDPAREAEARQKLDARLRAEELVAKASADRRAAMAAALDAAQVPAGALVDRVAGVIGQTSETDKAREAAELRRQQLADQRQELAVAQARAQVAALPVAARERELRISQMVLDAQRQGVALTDEEIRQRRELEADRAAAAAQEWKGNRTAELAEELALARQRQEVAALDIQSRERELQVIDLISAARREGITLTDQEIAGYRARLAEIQAVDLATQRVTDAQDFLADSGERAFDRIGSAITETYTRGEKDVISFGSVAQGVLSEVMQSFIQLAAINPLKNALFGTNSPVLSDVGGIIGKLFGGGGSSILSGPNVGSSTSFTAPTLGQLYHDGGVAGGSPVSRSVAVDIFEDGRRRRLDAELWAAPWTGAGLVPDRAAAVSAAGLRAGEVPARLALGDEVLTRDDPRHRAQIAQRAAVATIRHGGEGRMPAVTGGTWAGERVANSRVAALDLATRPAGPNEVLALLMAGEEVLTREDPRHRDNLRVQRAPAIYHTGGVAGEAADERPWSMPPAASRRSAGGGSAIGGGSDVIVQVIDQRRMDGQSAAGDGVQVQRGRDAQGREIVKILIAEIRKGIETGQFDRSFSSSFGLRRVGR